MAPYDELKILVTGASGFLGAAVVEELLSRHPSWHLCTLDIRPLDPAIASRVERHFAVDITEPQATKEALAACLPDIVLHTAGIVPARQLRYSTNEAQWNRVRSINCDGTRNVLDATLDAGCRRFVYTSSCTAVIDDIEHDHRGVDESIPLGLATLHYGMSKGMAEQYVLSPVHVERGLKACALRPATIIGPGDTQVLSMLYDCILNGETPFVVGDGFNISDWMYIDNAVHAHMLALENLLGPQTAAGHAFFISNQEPVYFWDFLRYVWAQFDHYPAFRIFLPVSIAWLAGCVAELFTWIRGSSSSLSRGSVKDGIRTYYSNNSKAQEILNYHPRVGIAEGVRLSCMAFKERSVNRSAAR